MLVKVALGSTNGRPYNTTALDTKLHLILIAVIFKAGVMFHVI